MSVTITRSNQPLKPPAAALTKCGAISLWFDNQELRQAIRVAQRRVRDAKESRGRHKVAAKAASSRCADLESRIAALESRATAAEARVEELSRDIAQREQCTASRALRQRLLILVKEFHPDRTTYTTPTLVTARLTSLIELLDSALYRR